jgi:AcrR family transcriptional regulator/DNA-binding MarR family transcriptional regulator
MAAGQTVAVRRSYGSAPYVSGLQRARLLSAAFALVGERGYGGVTARSVSERAGVSTRTFYEAFSDREDCFLAAFNHALDGLELEACAGWGSERGWAARVRAALTVLLGVLDREPAVRRLVFVEALGAGPRVLARRGGVLDELALVVDGGRAGGRAPAGLPGLTAAAVVGGCVGVIHARLLEANPGPLIELQGELMATIVLPYRGSKAAARELQRPVAESSTRVVAGGVFGVALGSASPVDYRLTARAGLALEAVAERPGVNNREVSEMIGLSDQSQVSRIMKRLQEQGLVENTQSNTKRLARAWHLTAQGRTLLDTQRGEDLVEAPRPAEPHRIARGFRLTALTHDILSAVAGLSKQGTRPTNYEIAELPGVKDTVQISKLLTRLQDHDLLQNTSTTRGANAWQLTPRGEEILHASQTTEPTT